MIQNLSLSCRFGQVGEYTDLHNVVGNLSMSGARGKDNRNCEDGAR